MKSLSDNSSLEKWAEKGREEMAVHQEQNMVEDLVPYWNTIVDEVEAALGSNADMAGLQKKYNCPVTVLNLIWFKGKQEPA
jgi:hypothetical protein